MLLGSLNYCLPLATPVQIHPRQQPGCCRRAARGWKMHWTSHRSMPSQAVSKKTALALQITHPARSHRWQHSAHLCTSTSTVLTSSRQHRRKVMQRSGGVSGPTAPPRHSGEADNTTASPVGAAAQRYPAHRQPGWPATRRMTARRRPHCRFASTVLVFNSLEALPQLICAGFRSQVCVCLLSTSPDLAA